MARTLRRRVTATASCVALASVLTCCSSGRSTAEFCDRLHEGKQEIIAHLNDGGVDDQTGETDPLLAMFAMGNSIVELRDFTHDLAKVAPDEIKDDMQALADFADQVFEQAGGAIDDPLGAGFNTFMGAVNIQGNLRAVDTFAEANCGEGI